MKNYIDESQILDTTYWINKIKEEIKPPRQRKKYKIQPFNCILKNAPNEIKGDEKIALLALSHGKALLSNVHENLRNDKNFILKYINQCFTYVSFLAIPEHLQQDDDVFYSAFKKDYTCFKYACWKTNKYFTREHIEKLVQINGILIKDLPKTYRDDLEIAQLAITQNLDNILLLSKKVSAKLLTDKDYCKSILDKNPETFPYMSAKIRGDKELMLPYLKKKPSLLKSANKKLFNDKEFMSNFLGSGWFSIYVGDELKQDRELMLRATVLYPQALYCLTPNIKPKDFCLEAVQLNANCYRYLSAEHKKDADIINVYIHHSYVYNDKYERIEPIELLDKEIKETAYQEYLEHPKIDCLSLQDYIRQKYLKISLNNQLTHNNDIQNKKIKI